MPQDNIQNIKNRLGIEEVIGSYIKLEKSGNSMKAKCPFHNEKTPSFFISPERGTYYCFGCGAKGDIFNFVQEFENMDFVGSLKLLAEKAGVELTKDFNSNNNQNKILYEILEEATVFFQLEIQNNKEALNYLKDRGLDLESLKKWRIGYIGSDWKKLSDHLLSKKFPMKLIEEVGLVKTTNNSNYYDRFRERIIFPIFDSLGRPIAFTGRFFGSKEQEKENAKYLNSPETILFSKSNILYGFNFSKNFIRKFNFSILVEGQMDTIMAHQTKFVNAVASSGTALTLNQLKLLNRFSQNLVIAYDADNAGIQASHKAWQIALSLGMNVKIADIKNDDPAELIKKDKDLWYQSIKNSKHIIEFGAENILKNESDSRKRGMLLNKEVIPYLAQIKSSIDQAHFVEKISDMFNLESRVIWKELENSTSNEEENNKNEKMPDLSSKINNSVEKRIAGIIFLFQNQKKEDLVEEIKKELSEIIKNEEVENILKVYHDEFDQLVFTTELLYKTEKDFRKDFEEIKKNLKMKNLIKKRALLKEKLKDLEKKEDPEADNVWQEIQKISKEIDC